MINSHLIFDKGGVYTPTICPRAILWRRNDDDPLYGVWVPDKERATVFAQVIVIGEDGEIVETIMQKEAA